MPFRGLPLARWADLLCDNVPKLRACERSTIVIGPDELEAIGCLWDSID